MRRITLLRTLGVTLALVAVLGLVAAVAAAPPQSRNFVAPLSGHEEVPPVATNARGVAIFQLSPDGTELSYKLIASNIENILQAHIHWPGAAGVNAGVVAFLYPDAPPAVLIPGRHHGVLATGTLTDADLIGALAGHTIADLVDGILAGNAYVNVHTTQNPGGEIRGQLP
jgi:CHRD domain